jgi:hypothetical protein
VQQQLREPVNKCGTIHVLFIDRQADGLPELAWDCHRSSAILRLPGKADYYLSIGGGGV